MDKEEKLKEDLYDIYLNGLDGITGFYASEAEESGLLAVYESGIFDVLDQDIDKIVEIATDFKKIRTLVQNGDISIKTYRSHIRKVFRRVG